MCKIKTFERKSGKSGTILMFLAQFYYKLILHAFLARLAPISVQSLNSLIWSGQNKSLLQSLAQPPC